MIQKNIRMETEQRLSVIPLFSVGKEKKVCPVRPSGLMMERGSLLELFNTLCATFARHFLEVQSIDAAVARSLADHFGLAVVQELWSQRFAFVAAATAWRKTNNATSEADMRLVSQRLVEMLPKLGGNRMITVGSADVFFSGSAENVEMPPELVLNAFDVTSDKSILVSDIMDLIRQCPDHVQQLASIVASDHGLFVRDEDTFAAFLELLLIDIVDVNSNLSFESMRASLLSGLLSSF